MKLASKKHSLNIVLGKLKDIHTLKEQIDLMSVCLAADDAFKKKKEVVIKYL